MNGVNGSSFLGKVGDVLRNRKRSEGELIELLEPSWFEVESDLLDLESKPILNFPSLAVSLESELSGEVDSFQFNFMELEDGPPDAFQFESIQLDVCIHFADSHLQDILILLFDFEVVPPGLWHKVLERVTDESFLEAKEILIC